VEIWCRSTILLLKCQVASNFIHETNVNIELLKKLLKQGKFDHKFISRKVEMVSSPPSFEQWRQLLFSVGQGHAENGPIEAMELYLVDIPVRAVVRQINRLGCRTEGSCSGHADNELHRRHGWAYLDFQNPTSAMIALRLFGSLGYKTRLRGSRIVEIMENQFKLFELGLKLSKLDCIEEIKNNILIEREIFLEELLMIPGESRHEGLVQDYLLNVLPGLMDTFWMDDYGNIVGEKKLGAGPTILLSAHMDIKQEISTESFLVKSGNIWKRNEGILGADDRAGIAIILNILDGISRERFNGTIKVAFTVKEEIGQKGAENLDPNFYSDVDYAISFDRRNGGDIITRSSHYSYSNEDYGRKFEAHLWSNHSYKMTQGGISDLRVWSQAGIPSVNLSIGFYDEHKPEEYLNLEEWHRAHDLAFYVLGLLSWKYSMKTRRKNYEGRSS